MKKNITFFLLVLLSLHTYAQKENLTGLWEVEKVSVGEKNMTPVAKWFRINPDGKYQAGNGWLQNGKGNWSYDAESNMYTATDSLDITDEFGGFTVSFGAEKMFWEREEEGMHVKVTLMPIKELPMSPADYLKGVWDLVEITKEGQSVLSDFDSKDKHKLFIRWDRVYINFSPEGERLTGYWHIHGHRPEVTLIPHVGGGKSESWKIEVDHKELLMSGLSDSNKNIKRKYIRRNTL
ncbi:hypothetical protein [Salibacter halophilus]|uniref:Lipocalin-like domain-containing protein n=1 Tax=Salibacter halophilus TaxID=1803916 RepID=A0A6N6MAG2_9FLAO|nr:hypothetical protein [Salibacter halophilus]KAB1065979.1 hypothetical protein F3059_00465 [Salibacter halophilus]